jgi:hypothetical protein
MKSVDVFTPVHQVDALDGAAFKEGSLNPIPSWELP